ncbi:DUF7344 domain-containing protein [Halosimplex salinum]|uniref:DUF7344 domain-containing protein n=1 Tax=Halosimplex salinum TaxID=1710538 RepID=UPI000F497AD2|nr:hypothetical protein [Halosimplex salinum]
MVGTGLDFDAVLELCADTERRIVLAVLADERRPLTLDDLTKTVVKHTHDTPLADVSGEAVTDVKIRLHHAHVPRLEAAGLVEYDPERGLVEPTAAFDRIEPHLSAILDADPVLAGAIAL